MNTNKSPHKFHVPVMGIGYTIDTPIKIAKYGISSVISLVSDILIEKMREYYSVQFGLDYKPIIKNSRNARAERITAYLNLLHDVINLQKENLKTLKEDNYDELFKYYDLLDDNSDLKKEYIQRKKNITSEFKNWLVKNITFGSIDVNIMTKMDRENYENGEKIPEEFNDGRQAIKGFAESKLHSSVILSSGMNPKLYGFMENFSDFYPDETGYIKKKIVLKVSDFRSAQVQGKFLAKKGLWVSEYRIESGLNCGGHAFATAGYLFGPILEEFKNSKEELSKSTFELLQKALISKGLPCPKEMLNLKITAQGGVGTNNEHKFLLDYYNIDSVGWGTPFLLVDEVVSIDNETQNKLALASEKDLYPSNISPLGILFNNLKGNTKDLQRDDYIKQGTPGSICTQKYAAGNTEYTEESICLASRKYQKIKIEELKSKNLSVDDYNKEFKKITEKSCICVGLTTSVLIKYGIDTKTEGNAVSICPGPNMAYFSEKTSLNEMSKHIYGKTNLIKRKDRPNFFVKELQLYVENLKERLNNVNYPMHILEQKYINDTFENLLNGINYYHNLFQNIGYNYFNDNINVEKELLDFEEELKNLKNISSNLAN